MTPSRIPLIVMSVVAFLLTVAASVLAVLLYSTAGQLDTARGTLKQRTADLTAVRAQLATSEQAEQAASEATQNLRTQLDGASTCSANFWGTSRIMVVCGARARDATAAVTESQTPASGVSSFLTARFPLEKLVLDLTYDSGTGLWTNNISN